MEGKQAMKRIVMITAGIILAAMTQAATIDWGMANYGVTWKGTGLNTVAAGATYYLILGNNLASIETAIQNDTFSPSMAGVLATGKSTGAKGYVATTSVDSSLLALGGTVYQYHVLVFDVSAGTKYYQISASQSETAYTAGDSVYADAKTVTFGAGAFNTANWKVYPVPEPTSMALLALGAVAIGFRRRFHK
jgi:PEP-CTERM putative exosortase interaction domain